MSDNELPGPTEKELLTESLSKEATVLIGQERKTPEFSQQALKLMDDMETAREKLGGFCVTVGEGEDRAVVMSKPVSGEKSSSMILDIQPSIDQGRVNTTHEDWIIVDKAGIYKAVNIVDQRFGSSDNGDPVKQGWEERMRPMVQIAGQENDRRLKEILSSGKYPESPDGKRSVYGVKLTHEQHLDIDDQNAKYAIGEYVLSPRWKSASFVGSDIDFDTLPIRGWHTGDGFITVRVTQPESFSDALKTSIQVPASANPQPI